MDNSHCNHEIMQLLDVWEWCSRALHVNWKRKCKNRNSCLMGMAYAITEETSASPISPFKLTKIYKTLRTPLLNKTTVRIFWEIYPVALLEMCLGSFTKGSPLAEQLNRLRLIRQNNPTLDKIFKKMRSREKRFGDDWLFEGHHPESEFAMLKKEMAPLCSEIKALIIKKHAVVETLAQEVLAQGPWQFGEPRASWFVRKTPESLLNRTVRLKLWQAARDVLSQNLEEEEELQALCDVLYGKITPSVKAAIEAQGYSVDNVVDDVLNFDMHKSREEITASPPTF